MKRILHIFILFCTCFLSAQNQIFKAKVDRLLYYADEKKLANTDENKIKIKFSSLDNGNCFVFNRLLDGNKTGKVLSYFKEYGVVVVRSQNKLDYFTFNEAFPKGGFYKTNTTKNIFGKEATLYNFDNDVMNIQLWIVSGNSEKTEFEAYLNNMGLLQNIPTNSSISVVNIMGIEFDASDFKVENEGNYRSNLNDILVTFEETKDSLTTCYNANQPKKILLSEIEKKIKLNFDYKINYKVKVSDYSNETKQEIDFSIYSDKDGTIDLQIFDEPIDDGINFRYTNTLLNQQIVGSYEGSKFKILGVETLNRNACFNLKEKIVSKENGIINSFIGFEHEFGLLLLEENVGDYPNYKNRYFSNGLITKRTYLDKNLDKQEYTCTVENGAFTFTLEK